MFTKIWSWLNKRSELVALTTERLSAFKRGFGLMVAWVCAIAIIAGAVAYGVLTYLGLVATFEDVFKVGLLIVLSAVGANVNVASTLAIDGIPITTFVSLGLRPTLITLILFIAAYRFGSKLASSRSELGSRIYASVGVGIGFSATAGFLSWLFQGSTGSMLEGVSAILPFDFSGLFLSASILISGAWIGSSSLGLRNEPRDGGPVAWIRTFLFLFVRTYAVLLVLATLGYLLYRWIEPDWAIAQAETQSSSIDWSVVIAVAMVVLLYLPSLLLSLFGFGMGSNVGLQFNGNDLAILDIDWFLQFIFSYSLDSVSLELLTNRWIALAAIGVVVIVAAASGVATSGRVNFQPKTASHYGIISLLGLGVVALLISLINFGYEWTNDGSSLSESSSTNALLQTGSMTFGLSITTTSLLILFFISVAFLSSKHGQDFVSQAFPRLMVFLGSAKKNASRRILARIFGVFISTVTTGALVLALGGVSVERIWAWLDGPEDAIQNSVSSVLSDDLNIAKEAISVKNSYPWLEDSALEIGQSQLKEDPKVIVKNLQGRDWAIGDLDALGTVSWKTSHGKAVWRVETDSKLKTHWKLVEHPQFKAFGTENLIRVTISQYATDEIKKTLKINGSEILSGIYNVLPGAYQVTMDGYRLLAPTDAWLVTSTDTVLYTAGTDVAVPIGAAEILLGGLETEKAKCEKFDATLSNECFPASSVNAGKKVKNGTVPSSFFASERISGTFISQKCKDQTRDRLISASEMNRLWECSATVEFKVRYFDYRIEKRNQYRKEYYYYYCGFNICIGSRTVLAGTKDVKVRGASLGDVTYTSDVTYNLNVRGKLDDNGKFSLVKP